MERVAQSRIKRVKKKRQRKWLIRILLSVLVTAIGIGAFVGTQIFGAVSKGHDDTIGKSALREKKVEPKTEPFTVLLIGTDQINTEGEKKEWRPDVMMLAAINPRTKSMKIVSIPRDTYVTIANTNGHKDKINSASTWGKLKGVSPVKNTIQTVENFLNVPVDYYAKINFKGFTDLVNVMGGVDVYNSFYFRTQGFEDNFKDTKHYTFTAGNHHLNGDQALAFVRMRKKDPEGDHGRNKRQQQVISKLLEKMVSFEGLTKFNEITKVVGDNFSYSFDPTDFLSLQATYNSVKGNTKTIKLTTTSEKKNGIWYEICSPAERKRVSQELQQQIEYVPKHGIGSESNTSTKTQGDGN